LKNQSEIFEYPLLIHESHLDTLGHMNNATYLEIFEDARWELITRNGYGLKEVHETQISPIILEINIKFKREVRNRENVVVKTYASDYNGKIGKIRQTMVRQDGDEACVAEITFGLFDMKARKLIPPTPEWLKAIGMD
jgi:thioesterase III